MNSTTLRDHQFKNVSFQLSEMKHHYGSQLHLLSDPYLLSLLAKLCSSETTQPVINELIHSIYTSLLNTVIAKEFPTSLTRVPTRMNTYHPQEAYYEGPVINSEIPVVCVNLARAGTYPSHLCYTQMNYLMNPAKVRQDHISIARRTNQQDQVTGSHVSGHKIGGSIDQSIVLFHDPMGATGSTIIEALDIYKSKKQEKALKLIALHCIVTPEYIKKVTQAHPDIVIYAVRLDRGLSSETILKTELGSHWEQEKGLNEKHYIVPGGGGFGEVMNNSYV